MDSVVSDGLGAWLESHPAALSAIVSKALTAARAAEAARKARELVRRKHVLTRSTLPGKLADCTSSKRCVRVLRHVHGVYKTLWLAGWLAGSLSLGRDAGQCHSSLCHCIVVVSVSVIRLHRLTLSVCMSLCSFVNNTATSASDSSTALLLLLLLVVVVVVDAAVKRQRYSWWRVIVQVAAQSRRATATLR